ncbi:MAG TPA: hypothetical protein VLE19_00370 [Pyrinomonadaceae bacterium]|nr:hypothetical protein [Pyrinomonadaceae bacterium]
MFARHLIWKVKPNSIAEFTRITENQIIPLLFKHKGFREQMYFVAPERLEVISASLWDSKEDAEAYNRAAYPEVLRLLSAVSDGAPTVKTFEIASSTGLKAAAKGA